MLLKLIKKIPFNFYDENIVKSIDYILSYEFKNLSIEWDITIKNKNIYIKLNGNDLDICSTFISKTYGITLEKDKIEHQKEYLGYIKQIRNNEIVIDCGPLFKINEENFRIFGVGSIKQICSRFGLVEELPLKIEINSNLKFAKPTKWQVDYLWSLKKTENDYLLINNCTKSMLKDVLKKTKHQRDIIKINRLGLLEHIIICKKTTDGPGLVSSIGPFLKSKIGVIIGNKK